MGSSLSLKALWIQLCPFVSLSTCHTFFSDLYFLFMCYLNLGFSKDRKLMDPIFSKKNLAMPKMGANGSILLTENFLFNFFLNLFISFFQNLRRLELISAEKPTCICEPTYFQQPTFMKF